MAAAPDFVDPRAPRALLAPCVPISANIGATCIVRCEGSECAIRGPERRLGVWGPTGGGAEERPRAGQLGLPRKICLTGAGASNSPLAARADPRGEPPLSCARRRPRCRSKMEPGLPNRRLQNIRTLRWTSGPEEKSPQTKKRYLRKSTEIKRWNSRTSLPPFFHDIRLTSLRRAGREPLGQARHRANNACHIGKGVILSQSKALPPRHAPCRKWSQQCHDTSPSAISSRMLLFSMCPSAARGECRQCGREGGMQLRRLVADHAHRHT